MRSLTRNDIRQEVLYFASCNVALSKSVTERPYRRNHGTRISWTSESRVKRSQGVERMNVAVVGAGIFGMAAAIELGERGHSVTVYEQGTVPHPKATSTDVSKVIRRTWYAGDNETYVELVERAAAKWREWEALLGSPIYHVTGALKVLPGLEPGTPMYESLSYLKGRGAEVSLLSLDEVRTRFPQFVVRKGETFVYDPWQGYLESGRAVAGLAELARRSGIEINQDTPVQTIDESDGGVALDLQAGAAALRPGRGCRWGVGGEAAAGDRQTRPGYPPGDGTNRGGPAGNVLGRDLPYLVGRPGRRGLVRLPAAKGGVRQDRQGASGRGRGPRHRPQRYSGVRRADP